MKEFAKLERVDLREGWQHEAHDFTTWLAQEDNLASLGDELGLSIVNPQTEYSVGDFSVDIYAEEADTNHKVIIENQLEMTDHDHLGKLITYASGVDAKYVIWIFKDIREEHRRAIDWLNTVTNSEIRFYAIRMELWRMGSYVAPKFHAIATSNEWAKSIKSTSTKITTSKHTAVWTRLLSFPDVSSTMLKTFKLTHKNWQNYRTGKTCHLGVWSKPSSIDVYGWVIDLGFRSYAYDHRVEIEEALGFTLTWDNRRVHCDRPYKDISNDTEMAELYEWVKLTTDKFHRVMTVYINKYKSK